MEGRRTRRRRRPPWLWIAAIIALLLLGFAAGFFLPQLLTPQTAPPPPSDPPVSDLLPTPAPPVSDPLPTPAPPVSDPLPTPEPTPDPLDTLLSTMTLRDKICQMLLLQPSQITHVAQVVSAGDTTRKALEKYPVGGLLYDSTNIRSRSQLSEMLSKTKTFCAIPPLLTCDQEGGRVSRLKNVADFPHLSPMLDYQTQGPDRSRQNAQTTAEAMAALGFNFDLAPVADVWSNPQNTVIGDRAYSDDYDTAAQLIPAAVEGFHAGGVGCVLKHFPGHGSTTADSHFGSAYVYRTLDELRQQDFKPFQAGIRAGADAVMMGHLIVPDISDAPAVFSPEIVTDLLREELGFDGVIMTDALRMQAITDHFSTKEVALSAVKAGVDMLLCPPDVDGTIQALTDAVNSGELPESRIDESVRRILLMKADLGILDLGP